MVRLVSALPLLALAVSALALVWAHLGIAALTVCLNETPVFLEAHPPSAVVAERLLPLFSVLGVNAGASPAACDAAAPARAMSVAAIAYLAGMVVLDRARIPTIPAWTCVLTAAVVVQGAMFIMPALLSSDILDYASHGRVASLHGANPYMTPPSMFPADPFANLGAWASTVTVYGPLWTRIDATVTALLPAAGVLEVAYAYKLLALASELASAALMFWIARRWTRLGMTEATPLVALTLWLWNPIVNVELVGNAHNEAVMIFFVLLALAILTAGAGRVSGRRFAGQPLARVAKASTGLLIASLRKAFAPGLAVGRAAGLGNYVGRPSTARASAASNALFGASLSNGFGTRVRQFLARASAASNAPSRSPLWLAAILSLWLGALVKFVPAGVAAIVCLVWLRQAPTARHRLVRAVTLATALLIISIVVAWPWLDSPAVAEPLLGLAAGGQRFKDVWQDAPAAWLTVRVVPLLGVPDDPDTLRMDVARTIVWGVTRTLFAAYVAAEAWLLWRRVDADVRVTLRRIACASVRALLMAVLLYVSQVYAWYFLWPLPMACLLGLREPWSRAAIVFGLAFLPAYYLREFQSYGVFCVPLYAVLALAILALTWFASLGRGLARSPS